MWKLRLGNEADHDGAALQRLMLILWWGLALAVAALLASEFKGVVAALGIGGLILLAAFAGGSFFGFLFGLPKVVSSDSAGAGATPSPLDPGSALMDGTKPAPEPTGAAAPTARARLLQSSTNLEKISDWLTTMIVGATLVELHRVNEALVAFRDFLARTATVFPAETGPATAGPLPVVGPIVLIFGAICGFLYMYLNTRLVLVRLFATIERFLAGDPTLPGPQQRVISAIAENQEGLDSTLRQQSSSPSGWTVENSLGLMFDLLYKNDPDRVVQLGAELSTTAARGRADYWFYLAAAFGQKLHRLPEHGDEWMSARDKALDAARRAVSIAPHYRDRLWAISNPRSSDNDLAPLRNDPEFLKIVGRTTE